MVMNYDGFPLHYRLYLKTCDAFSKMKGILLNIALIASVLLIVLSGVFGYKVMFIMSESMEPLIKTHQFVFGEKVRENTELEIGDICTYKPDNIPITITHRIIGVKDGNYIFKGDNNEFQDADPVRKDQIMYRLILY